MRILAFVFACLLATPVVTAMTTGTALAQVQTEAQQSQEAVDNIRTEVRGALNTARQFIGDLFVNTKETLGMNDEQLFGTGVGILTGLLVADIVGSGGFGSFVFAAAGGLFGKWVTTPK